MAKQDQKQYGKSASAVWIDEHCGMSVKHPNMHTMVGLGKIKYTAGEISLISTPPGNTINQWIEELAASAKWEEEIRKTKLGRLLYV